MATSILKALKTVQLRHAAFLLGIPNAGRKPELATILARQAEISPVVASQRILSVDMGIRNLAYCVVDTVPEADSKHNVAAPATNLHVSTWSKADLLEHSPEATALDTMDESPKPTDQNSADHKAIKDVFNPSQLSKTASKITEKLLAHRPDTILIERQRFRSGGCSNIQEWTVRVNMLESMLWACLRTLEAQTSSTEFPTAHEVNPARVAKFWVSSEPMSLRLPMTSFYGMPSAAKADRGGPVTSKKVQKVDKINIVRSWLEGSADVKLTFEGEAATLAEHFRSNTGRGSGKSSEVGKLDDLADCLLQAAAWARWEENKRAFAALVAKTMAG